jgi:hypothetical protein
LASISQSRVLSSNVLFPYAYQQAGKIEQYICMIEEGGQVLLADSGLSMLFWKWAVFTSQYLHNQLPTFTLASTVAQKTAQVFTCFGEITSV